MEVLHFAEIFASMLKERDIFHAEADEFLNPDYSKLHNPLLLPDIEKARDRVIQGIKKNEHIVVFSDYDADGIPGAVILSDFFKRIGYQNVSFYIPHRHDEGFGLNKEAIKEIKSRGTKLLITVDCGTADHSEVKQAQKAGIDVIITDHHESDEIPKAYAVVNPKRKDSTYPFKELCGAGLAYKLVQTVLDKERFGVKEGMEKWSLDMVAIATLSDMVPLLGENRILAKFGLSVLKKSPRPGLSALLGVMKMERANLTEDDVVFMITPRINAASRMGVPMDAFNLLSTSKQTEAQKYAFHLEHINNERKGIVAQLVKDAKHHLSNMQEISPVIVIGNPDWKPALLGLVASSLVEDYLRPVFVWGRDGDGVIKGSCRSYDGIDLYELMKGAKSAFSEFGGHAGAGGFSASLEQITTLEDKLSKALEKLERKDENILESINAFIEIQIEDVGENLWNTIEPFAPFGIGNPKPVFLIKHAEIKSAKNFGKKGDHLEIVFKTKEGKSIKAIQFFTTIEDQKVDLKPGSKITFKAHLEKSYFLNNPEIRLRIIEIQP